MNFFKNTKGFTLVEMVLYVSICSLFLLVLSTFLTYLLGARIRSQTIAEVNQQGFQVMHRLTSTIRNGRSIEVPGLGSSSSTLAVTTGVPLVDPTMFYASSGVMTIREASNNPVPLTNSRVVLSNLVFQNVSSSSSSDKIIRISFTLSHINLGGREEYTFIKNFSGSATLRQ